MKQKSVEARGGWEDEEEDEKDEDKEDEEDEDEEGEEEEGAVANIKSNNPRRPDR